MASILVVDDEAKLGAVIAEALEGAGHEVVRAGGGRAALAELALRDFDVVVTDLKMPEVDGMDVLREARRRPTPPEVVVMTAYGTTESAVEAMKGGAADYLVKPFSFDELLLRVDRLGEQRRSEQRTNRMISQLTPSLVAESPAMRKALEMARQVAASDATVLLLGESGTGKTQLARYIHFQGRRASGPLAEVHCAALSETLLESELFGHARGAFTGAVDKKEGHLQAARGGTLFLDEIGEIGASTQVKLLRFLQDREFVPVGSTEVRKVDVRVIAATNRDLAAAVGDGTFREDFYFRLNVFALRVPPLRERREDVLPLAHRFLSSRGIPAEKLTARARELLVSRTWPGNVRELENALERALILAGDGSIDGVHLDAPGPLLRATAAGPGQLLVEGFNLDAFELSLLHAALERAGGNKTAAARLLGISRRRLYSRLESLGQKTADPDRE